jgi:hypothetical protein
VLGRGAVNLELRLKARDFLSFPEGDIKVVWALAAETWLTYHILKVENPVPGSGVLLSGN